MNKLDPRFECTGCFHAIELSKKLICNLEYMNHLFGVSSRGLTLAKLNAFDDAEKARQLGRCEDYYEKY